MMKHSHVISNAIGLLELPEEGVRHEALYDEEDGKATLYAFARGAHFFEHTTPDSVQIYVLTGEATFTVGDDIIEASAGALLYVPAGMPHGVRAQTPTLVLATFLKATRQ